MRIHGLYLVLVAFLALAGCTVEQKLARSYVSTEHPGRFLVLEPGYLLKYNLKDYEIPGLDSLDEYTRDSLLIENSMFLKDVTDSLLLAGFVNSFSQTLELYGAEVVHEQFIDTLMQDGGRPYILNIAQFSLEEFIHPYYSEEVIYDEVLVISGFDVNAINFNVWLELGRMNTDQNNKILFLSDFLTDDINGLFKQNLFSGKVVFDYTIDTLTVPGIYGFARWFGEKTANRIYDYLLNDYIRENLPENYPFVPRYYHYDPVRKVLYSSEEQTDIIEVTEK